MHLQQNINQILRLINLSKLKIMAKLSWYILGTNSVTLEAYKKPILEQAQIDFGDIIFLNYEQTKNKDIANFLKISYWTTIVVYKNNKQIAKAIGLNEKNDIYNLIKKGI